MEQLIAGSTAALLTLFDLDRTFYIPTRTTEKTKLYLWWWGFVLTNGLLAAALSVGFASLNLLPAIEQGWLRGIAVGVGFLAIIRAKLTTFRVQDREVPFGPELLYEGAKEFVYKRINRVALESRYQETVQLAESEELGALGRRAKLRIDQDVLLAPEEKTRTKAWLLRVVEDDKASDLDKKTSLADFILSGQFHE